MAKKYKKIEPDTIEETDTKTEKSIYSIKDLKERRESLKKQLKIVEDILKAVNEI